MKRLKMTYERINDISVKIELSNLVFFNGCYATNGLVGVTFQDGGLFCLDV